jgi:acyl carrier protein
MISIDDFVSKLEKEFDDVPVGTLKASTNYKQMEQWTSMHALIIIAFIDSEFDIIFKSDDLKNTETISDLYKLIEEKSKN